MKNKLKLGKIKRKQKQKLLTDNQLSTLISEITKEYMDKPFIDIREELDERYEEAFQHSRYKYNGFKTDLGTIQDIDIFFNLKDDKD